MFRMRGLCVCKPACWILINAACFMFSLALIGVAGLAEDSDSEHFHMIISSSKLHSKRLRSQDLVWKKWSFTKKKKKKRCCGFDRRARLSALHRLFLCEEFCGFSWGQVRLERTCLQHKFRAAEALCSFQANVLTIWILSSLEVIFYSSRYEKDFGAIIQTYVHSRTWLETEIGSKRLCEKIKIVKIVW